MSDATEIDHATARSLGCAFCGELKPIGGLVRSSLVRVLESGELAVMCSWWLNRRRVSGVIEGCKTRTLRRYHGKWAEVTAGRQAELFEAHDLPQE